MTTLETARRPLSRLALLAALLFAATVPGVVAEEEPTGTPAMGRATFRVYCASCHGKEARGDGSVAEHLRIPPSDLTLISARNDGEFPAEQVALIIDGRNKVRGHGDSDMPVWGDAFKKTAGAADEDGVTTKIRDLTAYLASIQATE